jgi:1,5-anhydro-D-fructose reductase (1,5-anhydro-D-mannitol-forming)
MIRLGMLSFWHLHAKDYARAAEENPSTTIVAAWDEDPHRGAAEANRLGVDFHADLHELLAREDVDAVVVDAPTNMHREVIVAAARAGKHIFTEKVLAATLHEAEEIVREVDAAGVVLTVSMWRSDESYATAVKEILDSGVLGTLTQLRVRDGHGFALPTAEHPDGYLPLNFWDPGTTQGGVLIDLCHPVYLLCHLLGRPATVTATLGFHTGRAVEDNATITAGYPDGAVGIAETSYVATLTPFLIEAHGTAGSLLFTRDGIGELVAHRRQAQEYEGRTPPAHGPDGAIHLRSAASPVDPLFWQRIELPGGEWPKAFEKWVTHIQEGTTADANVALAQDLSALIEASYLSHAERRVVELSTLKRR